MKNTLILIAASAVVMLIMPFCAVMFCPPVHSFMAQFLLLYVTDPIFSVWIGLKKRISLILINSGLFLLSALFILGMDSSAYMICFIYLILSLIAMYGAKLKK